MDRRDFIGHVSTGSLLSGTSTLTGLLFVGVVTDKKVVSEEKADNI